MGSLCITAKDLIILTQMQIISAVKQAWVHEVFATNCWFSVREKCWIVPLVLHTGHEQYEQIEGEEDAQNEQHTPHIHLRCVERDILLAY